MRPKSMVLILIALACGLVASIGISQVVDKKSSEEPASQTAPIYVASVDVPIHEKITSQHVRREDWPIERIPPGAVTKLEDLDGRKPKQPFYKGEVILAARLVDPNSRVMTSERIPKGYRVVSVKVSIDSSVSGLLSPGDRVDVLVYIKSRGALSNTKTILTDVTVFAINDRISRRTGEEEDSSINAKTVSLTVTPKQAQRLILASELGSIRLTLRNLEDDSDETPDKTSLEDLSPGGNRNLFGGLPKMDMNIPEPDPTALRMPKKIKMEVVSPTTRQTFEWDDPNDKTPQVTDNYRGAPLPPGAADEPVIPSSSKPEEPAGNEAEAEADGGFDFDSLGLDSADAASLAE